MALKTSTTLLKTLTTVLFAKVTKRFYRVKEEAALRAGSIATEVLTSFRTVLAFGGEEKELKR